jgi:hypothetical protein
MRMALRAQSQCMKCLETLAAIKNPPTIFAMAQLRTREKLDKVMQTLKVDMGGLTGGPIEMSANE